MAEAQIEKKGRGRPTKANNKRPIEIALQVVPATPLQLIHQEADEAGESPAKRGRGRPKGSTKSNPFSKKPPVPGRGRGRPKKNEDGGASKSSEIES